MLSKLVTIAWSTILMARWMSVNFKTVSRHKKKQAAAIRFSKVLEQQFLTDYFLLSSRTELGFCPPERWIDIRYKICMQKLFIRPVEIYWVKKNVQKTFGGELYSGRHDNWQVRGVHSIVSSNVLNPVPIIWRQIWSPDGLFRASRRPPKKTF